MDLHTLFAQDKEERKGGHFAGKVLFIFQKHGYLPESSLAVTFPQF